MANKFKNLFIYSFLFLCFIQGSVGASTSNIDCDLVDYLISPTSIRYDDATLHVDGTVYSILGFSKVGNKTGYPDSRVFIYNLISKQMFELTNPTRSSYLWESDSLKDIVRNDDGTFSIAFERFVGRYSNYVDHNLYVFQSSSPDLTEGGTLVLVERLTSGGGSSPFSTSISSKYKDVRFEGDELLYVTHVKMGNATGEGITTKLKAATMTNLGNPATIATRTWSQYPVTGEGEIVNCHRAGQHYVWTEVDAQQSNPKIMATPGGAVAPFEVAQGTVKSVMEKFKTGRQSDLLIISQGVGLGGNTYLTQVIPDAPLMPFLSGVYEVETGKLSPFTMTPIVGLQNQGGISVANFETFPAVQSLGSSGVGFSSMLGSVSSNFLSIVWDLQSSRTQVITIHGCKN